MRSEGQLPWQPDIRAVSRGRRRRTTWRPAMLEGMTQGRSKTHAQDPVVGGPWHVCGARWTSCSRSLSGSPLRPARALGATLIRSLTCLKLFCYPLSPRAALPSCMRTHCWPPTAYRGLEVLIPPLLNQASSSIYSRIQNYTHKTKTTVISYGCHDGTKAGKHQRE